MVHNTWKEWVGDELEKPYFVELKTFLKSRLDLGAKIYPTKDNWTKALDFDPVKIQVVILGQDPYHGFGQAHGYAFSVLPGVKPPPSLRNIYKELQSDIPDVKINVNSGYLNAWAQQGVLLLNTVLTVEEGKPESHKGKGWEQFTDQIIKTISMNTNNVVFILWGAAAGKKATLIDNSKHLIIKSAHPSPLSAHNGFFGSKPFSKTNTYLRNHQKPGIDWSLI